MFRPELRLVTCAVMVALPAPVAASSSLVPYVGHLELDGSPVNGDIDYTFYLFTYETPAVVPDPGWVWSETQTLTTVNGRFAAKLGLVDPLPPYIGGDLWLEVEVDDPAMGAPVRLGGRQLLGTVPLAHTAPTPWQNTYRVTLSDPAAGDLGDLLNAELAKHSNVYVTLAAGTRWTWNNRLDVPSHKRLVVDGEGHTNGGNNITVDIDMDQNRTANVTLRDPNRATLREFAMLDIRGVSIRNNANDTRTLAPAANAQCIFVLFGDFSILRFTQSDGRFSEDFACFGRQTYARIEFGWTTIDQTSGSPRSVLATAADSGNGFRGHGGIVARSHTTLGTNVSYESTSRIIYLN